MRAVGLTLVVALRWLRARSQSGVCRIRVKGEGGEAGSL